MYIEMVRTRLLLYFLQEHLRSYVFFTYTKVTNFPRCGISTKIVEMRYNAENDILNKKEKNHVLKSPSKKFDKMSIEYN